MRIGWLEDSIVSCYRIFAITFTILGATYLGVRWVDEARLPPLPAPAVERSSDTARHPLSAQTMPLSRPSTETERAPKPTLPAAAPSGAHPTLADVIEPLAYPPIGMHTRSKLAASLGRLADRLDVFDAVAQRTGVDERLLLATATLESDGGRYLYPFPYLDQVKRSQRDGTPLSATVPRGFTHVMPATLEGALRQARAARRYFEGFGERWNALALESWSALDVAASYLGPSDLAVSRQRYGSARERDRNLLLAASVPDVSSLNLMDLEGSLLATAVVTAYDAAAIESAGYRLDDRTLLLAYVAGSGYVPRIVGPGEDPSNAEFVRRVRAKVGSDAAWYVSTGLEIIGELDRYATLEAAWRSLDARASLDR